MGYVGIASEDFGSITVGKQYGAYHHVASWTDTFATTGGVASGMAGSGNGNTIGTHRTEAIRYDLSVQGLNVAAQYIAGGNSLINDGVANRGSSDYGFGFAASYDLPMGLSAGAAYNHTKFVKADPTDSDKAKDAKAAIFGC